MNVVETNLKKLKVLSKEEDIKNNQIEIKELKRTITEIKKQRGQRKNQ